ncbi:MAG: GNAT family N-acetyltransferase [Clostridia bacterium]|nr:GNAT family N-acetyltransferase [Clostridia bacterium]
MIRFASTDMVDTLKALWLTGFPGDDDYCDFYFKHHFSPEHCAVSVSDEGEVEAAVHFYRGRVRIDGTEHRLLFLYAVATFPEYRGRGKFSEICRFLADYGREAGIPLIALSTTPPSQSPCERLGMVPKIGMASVSIEFAAAGSPPPCEPCGFAEFAALRSAFLCCDFEITWPEDTLRYMYDELHTSGGVLKTTVHDRPCYAAYTLLDDELLIRETDCPPEAIETLVQAVGTHLHHQGKLTVYSRADTCLPLESPLSREVFCYAHIWFLDESLDRPDACWYINLTAE